MDHLAQLESDLRPMAQMLRGHLGQIETKIEVAERELKELREARQKILSLARHVDPSLVPVKPKRNERPRFDVSQEKYEAFVHWLRENAAEIDASGGVYASGLMENPDFTIIKNGSQISKVLARAHEEGLVRIDSMGSGGRKNFKVIA